MNLSSFIKYYGTNSFFAGLIQDKDDEYYIVFGKTLGAILEHDVNVGIKMPQWYSDAYIKIPFITDKKGALFHLMKLNNKEEFDTVLGVLKIFYE